MFAIVALLALLSAEKTRFSFLSKPDDKDCIGGLDQRHKESPIDEYLSELHKLEDNHKRLDILRTLENMELSNNHKIALINQFQYLINGESVMNITSGGLYEDWDIEF